MCALFWDISCYLPLDLGLETFHEEKYSTHSQSILCHVNDGVFFVYISIGLLFLCLCLAWAIFFHPFFKSGHIVGRYRFPCPNHCIMEILFGDRQIDFFTSNFLYFRRWASGYFSSHWHHGRISEMWTVIWSMFFTFITMWKENFTYRQTFVISDPVKPANLSEIWLVSSPDDRFTSFKHNCSSADLVSSVKWKKKNISKSISFVVFINRLILTDHLAIQCKFVSRNVYGRLRQYPMDDWWQPTPWWFYCHCLPHSIHPFVSKVRLWSGD